MTSTQAPQDAPDPLDDLDVVALDLDEQTMVYDINEPQAWIQSDDSVRVNNMR